MWQIGVWERDEGLAERVSRLAEGVSVLVRACRHPALLAGQSLDLLVVSRRGSASAPSGATPSPWPAWTSCRARRRGRGGSGSFVALTVAQTQCR